jgi:LGFP repeat
MAAATALVLMTAASAQAAEVPSLKPLAPAITGVPSAAAADIKAAAAGAALGSAVSAISCGLANGGCYQNYPSGVIHWSPATGAHISAGAIGSAWAAQGWENGPLAYPSTNEAKGLSAGGAYQSYQGGQIHWSPATGAHATVGAIGAAWAAQGWENGSLGYPTANEAQGLAAGGAYQSYQGGQIHWSPATGAHSTTGAIWSAWAAQGWENGALGYPTTNEYKNSAGSVQQDFQGGSFTWSPASGIGKPAPVGKYPTHANIVSTTFWVGEIFNASVEDGSQVCSTYDSQWAYRHTGVRPYLTPGTASACPGSSYGGCDGVTTGTTASTFHCATERRSSVNGYFPTSQATPRQNPFYLDLPYDDVNDPTAFAHRCSDIPWAAADNAATGVNNCANENYSYMKNRWVQITGPNGQTCYGQIEDAGPSSGSLYHDSSYVFGSGDARPANKKFSGDPSQGAGMDVSPALNGCLGFADLDGDSDHVSWRFVDAPPPGPWTKVVTAGNASP